MKTKALLFIVFTVTLFALGILTTTVFNTAPTSPDAIAMFYGSAFVTIFGLLFFGQFVLKWGKDQNVPVGSNVTAIFRNATILAVLLLGLLAFKANNLLNIATIFVVVAAAIMLLILFRRRLTA